MISRTYPSSRGRARGARVDQDTHEVAVDRQHAATLEALLGAFHTAVALEMPCDLAEVKTSELENHACFRAHFPAFAIALEEWNATVAVAEAAPEALWRRFANSARDRGITEPPFVVGVLIDQLATSTVERSRRWELDTPQETQLEHFNDRLEDGTYVSVYVMGRRVATLPGGAEPDVQRRIDAADALIRGLFDEARTCAEARSIADAQEALLTLKQRLLDELEDEQARASINVAAACTRCRREQPAERSPS
jgi:hypothetical protein